MSYKLRQSTAGQIVWLGRFLDNLDGDTAKTALSIANTDIKVRKAGATAGVSKNSGGATHDANGYYYATFDATDTNTLGPNGVISCKMTGALDVRHEFEVLAADVWDALYASSGGGLRLADGAITAAKIADGAVTAAKFAANALDAVWSTASRLLTAGTNIVLAKGTGVTGFSDLDAAGVRAAVGLASANLDTQLDALPTNAELATALGTADDVVLAQVALVKAKTDALPADPADASDIAGAFGTVNATLSTIAGFVDTEVALLLTRIGSPAGVSLAADVAAVKVDSTAILVDTAEIGAAGAGLTAITSKTDNLPAAPAAAGDIPTAIQNADALRSRQLTESYAADGVAPTFEQALLAIQQFLQEKSLAGTTLTVKKLDGTTTAMTFTLNSATAPTQVSRAT